MAKERHISLARSLAGRLLLWLLVMVGLPCLLYIFISSRQADQLYRNQVVETLQDLVDSRAEVFNVTMDSTVGAMRLVGQWLPWGEITEERTELSKQGLDLLNKITGAEDFLWAAYARPREGRYRIILSTDPIWEGSDMDHVIEERVSAGGPTITLADLPIGTKGMVVTLPVLKAGGTELAGVLVAVVNMRYVLASHASKPAVSFPIEMAILDTHGYVLITSYLPWGSMRFSSKASAPRGAVTSRLTPSSEYPGKWDFVYENRSWIAAGVPVAQGQVEIMAAVQLDDALAGEVTADWLFLALGFIVLLIGAAVALILSSRLIRPLVQLDDQMTRVRAGDWQVQTPHHPLGYELNAITDGVNRTVEVLRRSTQEAASAEAHAAALQKEWSVARQVQERTLPQQIPQVAGLELHALYQPAKEVAGDLYDLAVRQAPESAPTTKTGAEAGSELLMAIADVCGKGIGACLHALTLRGALRSAFFSARGLSEMVIYANRLFAMDTQATAMFATLAAALYQPSSRMLHYTCCGHTPLLLIHADGQVERLQTPGLALGVVEPITVQVGTVELKEGDVLVLYSDGVTEAHDTEGRLFGEGRLTEVVRAHRSQSSQDIVEAVIEAIRGFQGSMEQHDDITLVVARGVPL